MAGCAGGWPMPEARLRRIEARLRRHFAPPMPRLGAALHGVAQALAVPPVLALGALAGAPGMALRARLAWLAIRGAVGGRLPWRSAYELLLRPLDGVRHFELGWLLDGIRAQAPQAPRDLLDLSSPRLLPLLLLREFPAMTATLANPDRTDLARTQTLAAELGVQARAHFAGTTAEALAPAGASVDLVTCASVLEHLPGEGDRESLAALWRALRPGGVLALSLPCAAQACEEYTDLDEYGLGAPDAMGLYFGQRFYDEALLEARIFSVVGAPAAFAVYGERVPGAFAADRARRLRNRYYPHWREPLWLARAFGRFPSVAGLPGVGVAAMIFRKA